MSPAQKNALQNRPTVQAPAPSSGAQRPTALNEADIAKALGLFQSGDAKKAIMAIWRAQCAIQPGLNPKKPGPKGQAHSYRFLAQRLFINGDFQNAHLAISRASALDKNNAETHALLGFILPRLNDTGGAAQAARKAISLDTHVLSGHEALVRVLLEMGRHKDALNAAQTGVDSNPGHGVALSLLAQTLRHVGQDDAALKTYEQALRLSPHANPAIFCAMADIHHNAERFDEALTWYEKALSIHPQLTLAWAGRINTLQSQNRFDDARALYKKATDTVPNYQKSHFDFLQPLRDTPLGADATDARQVVLVNSIVSFPSPPLGPALIKANVEKNSDFRVTCMDLNTDWFTSIIDSQRDHTAAFHFKDSETLVKAAELFNHGGDAFFDDAQHEPLAETMARYSSLMADPYNEQCEDCYTHNGATPWYISILARRILAKNPAVVGLSVMFTHQFWSAALLARAIKTMRPQVKLTFGGGFFNEMNLGQFVARPYVDFVLLHDGEQTFLDLLNALNSDEPKLEDISGLAYINEQTDELIVNPQFGRVDYSALPYADFSDIDMKSHYTPEPVIPLISSRGCYWRRCTFCDHFASYAGTYKTQSIVRCVDEIEHHVKTSGARHFTFVDEMLSAKRFEKISEEILERGLDVRYYALAKPTADFTQDTLDIMYKSGCRCIYWGQESGSERVLALMDKGNTVESSSNTLKRATKAGIRNHLFMIVGFPSETFDELWESVSFIYEHKDHIDKILASAYVMKKGTPICEVPEQFGIKKIYADSSLCNSKILNYETAVGLPSNVTGPMADYLQLNLFDPIGGRNTYFGTPRNHIIIMYGKDDLAPLKPSALPSPEEVKATLRAITPSSAFIPEVTMDPIWDV